MSFLYGNLTYFGIFTRFRNVSSCSIKPTRFLYSSVQRSSGSIKKNKDAYNKEDNKEVNDFFAQKNPTSGLGTKTNVAEKNNFLGTII